MKNMRSLQPHRPPRRFPVGPIPAICIVVALVVAGASPMWLQRGVLSVTSPLWRARSVLAETVNKAAGRFMSRDELEAENDRLREENALLSIKGALYDERTSEVARLESLLGRGSDNERSILARVLASPDASPHDSFIIDRGASEGIASGDRVVFGHMVALGTIDVASAHTSRVSLFSTPDMTHEVSIGTTSARFEAVGQGGGMFLVRIPKEYSVAPNDALMEVGTNAALGFVRSIESNDADAFQTVYAVMPVNLFETREVIVVRSFSTTP